MSEKQQSSQESRESILGQTFNLVGLIMRRTVEIIFPKKETKEKNNTSQDKH